MQRRVYYPDAPAEAWFEMPVSSALFRHAQGNALFDTGCHPDAAIDGAARWGAHARYSEPIFTPEEAVTHQLARAGLVAGDIDLVICSHLHYDHCGCNAFFANATISFTLLAGNDGCTSRMPGARPTIATAVSSVFTS